jgi:hypothetical protein
MQPTVDCPGPSAARAPKSWMFGVPEACGQGHERNNNPRPGDTMSAIRSSEVAMRHGMP